MLALAITAFWLIFVAELGDKTLFVILLLSARGSPLLVFFGAALAFALHGLIAVGLGQLLAGLPPTLVQYGSAGLFTLFGLVLLLRPPESKPEGAVNDRRAPLAAAFVLVFLAEWGDMTQILSAALVADGSHHLGRPQASIAVFVGAVLGLWLGTGIAAFVGHKAGKWLPEQLVRRVAGVCFLAVAAYTVFGHSILGHGVSHGLGSVDGSHLGR